MSKHSPITLRRLRDGTKALELPEPRTIEEARSQLDTLHSGIAALQSLDDLGTEEENKDAWNDMIKLMDKYKRITAFIGETPKK